MWAARDWRLSFLPIVALVGLAWLTIAAWGLSPYRRYLEHDRLGSSDDSALTVTLLLAGWLLMVVAMMLPTSLPLVALFSRMTRQRPDGRRLVALLLGGYLAVWTAFGLTASLGDRLLHALVERTIWLDERAQLVGVLTLGLAGIYQLSRLKHRCLDRCRTPRGFILQRWSGRRPQRAALRLGLEHGLFCLGCCWHLMLLMFLVGVGNIGGMIALGAVMAAEKNAPWGRHLSVPLGVTLLGWSMLLAI